MSYSGPIYFGAVPCSPSCTGCPSALASSSCRQHQACTHPGSAGPRLAEASTGEFEWTRVGLETLIDSRLSSRRSRHPNRPSRLNDVQGPVLAGSRSFDFLPAPLTARALAYRHDDTGEGAEMTPTTNSWDQRTTRVVRPGKIEERSDSSPIALPRVSAPDASLRSDPKRFTTLPSCNRSGDHGRHASRNSIWSWVSGVDTGQQPLLDCSAPLRSNPLKVPYDVDMDRDLYSFPRPVPSSLNSHRSAAAMSPPGSSRSSPLSDCRPRGFDSASYTSDRAHDALNDWQHSVMDESTSFLASSPCPSSCSSTMGFASVLPREPIAMVDEPMYRILLDKWSESEEWKEEDDREREETTSGRDAQHNIDTYPRSVAASPHHSDIEMQHAMLPALLDQQGFSTLILQSFTLALADAALEQSDGFELFSATAEAEMEDDRQSNRSYPPHFQDFDFMEQWSPPALRSSSSASSLDPFHLELFSPASEQTDPVAVWESHRTPGESSDSREYFSSSPFVGWSSSSDTEKKPALLTLGHVNVSSARQLAEVPLYQPQPIRPILPINIPDDTVDDVPERGC